MGDAGSRMCYCVCHAKGMMVIFLQIRTICLRIQIVPRLSTYISSPVVTIMNGLERALMDI